MRLPRRIRSWWNNRRSRRLIYAIVLLVVLGAGYRTGAPGRGILDDISFSRAVYDRNGDVLRLILSTDEKYRVFTELEAFSPLLRRALLLKEDRWFRFHPGCNPVSLFRAGFRTLVLKRGTAGGSTVTMQLARLRYGLTTRTVPGKIRQVMRALYLELYYSKDEILEAYMNLAPCGGNIEGFGAAARIMFDRDVSELTLQDALLLCVLPQNPGGYRPAATDMHADLVRARNRLRSAWYRTYGTDTSGTGPDLPPRPGYHLPFHAPHFVNGLLAAPENGDRIHSTLLLSMQHRIERLVDRYVSRLKTRGVYNAAALLVDAADMSVVASIGSADFFNAGIQGQVDGTRSRRSPGSTLKPFIYGLALDQGIIHPGTKLKDAPVSFSEYAPDNYERDFRGPLSATEALVTSRNIPAVALANRIGDPDLYDFIHRTGVGDLKPRDHYGLSIVLGSAELTMEELVSLYGILANRGRYRSIRKIAGQTPSEFLRMLSPEAGYLVSSMLMTNPRPASTPLPSVSHKRPVAYKTGTSIGFKDSWAIGLFDHYILAVWLGNFNGYGNPEFIGRRLAAPLFFEIVDAIEPDEIVAESWNFPPDELVQTEICAVSGHLPGEHCRNRTTTRFIPGVSPITTCRICRQINVDTQTGYRTDRRSGPYLKKQVFEFWPTDIMEIYRQAGIPRRTPPPYPPQTTRLRNGDTGIPPKILSPLRETEYYVRHQNRKCNHLPLKAAVDADVREIFWYVDDTYIGSSLPERVQFWTLKPGTFDVAVVDDRGRSDRRSIRVSLVQ